MKPTVKELEKRGFELIGETKSGFQLYAKNDYLNEAVILHKVLGGKSFSVAILEKEIIPILSESKYIL